ncbi:MAG: acyltransferase family protein [Dermatophilaceae bacterium]
MTSSRPIYPLVWLRGLGALSVLVFHAYQYHRSGPDSAWPWSGLAHRLMIGTDLFVDMFFVLSGLLLWLPVARAAIRGDTHARGHMLLYRRMARLLPLYYTVVLVVWAMSTPVFPGEHLGDLFLHLTLTQVYSDRYIFWTNGPAWSLAVEFHFYLLMAFAIPLVHRGVRRVDSRRGRLLVASALPALCLVVGLGYLTWATVLANPGAENWSVWYSPLSRAADFGIGMGLGVLVAAGVRVGPTVRGLLATSGIVGLGALVLLRPELPLSAWWPVGYAAAVAVALGSIVLHNGPWPAALSWRPLAWVGGLGYGIYLLHEPVMRVLNSVGLLPAARPGGSFILTAVLVMVPSIALAWISSRTLERAGLRLLATVDRNGVPRDYYQHLGAERGADDDLLSAPQRHLATAGESPQSRDRS